MPDNDSSLPDVSTRLRALSSVKLAAARRWVGESQWFMASIASIAGVLLGYVMVVAATPLSRWLPSELWVISIADARDVMLAFIGVEITALSIVMSLTMIAIQSAASQFSNRLLRYYIRDKVQQTVFAVIAGSTAYFVTVSAILGMGRPGDVARPSLGLAVLLLMASGVALIVQVNHTLQNVRLEVILGRVVKTTARAFARMQAAYCEVPYTMNGELQFSDSAAPVMAHCSGYVAFEETKLLLKMASHHRYLVRVDVEVGNHALEGMPVGCVEAEDPNESISDQALRQVSESMGLSELRNPSLDPGLGLRLLVDIAVKALSSSLNDPYTAGKAVDHIATLLKGLVDQDLGPRVLLDCEGIPRVQMCGRRLRDYLALCCDQIARYGANEPLIVLRLLKMARDLGSAARTDADRNGAVAVLDATMAEVERMMPDPEWRAKLQILAEEAKEVVADGSPPSSDWPVEL